MLQDYPAGILVPVDGIQRVLWYCTIPWSYHAHAPSDSIRSIMMHGLCIVGSWAIFLFCRLEYIIGRALIVLSSSAWSLRGLGNLLFIWSWQDAISSARWTFPKLQTTLIAKLLHIADTILRKSMIDRKRLNHVQLRRSDCGENGVKR